MVENLGQDGAAERPEGERWLEMIGRGDFIGRTVTLRDGRTIQAEHFTEVCGDEAHQIFTGIESSSPEDPLHQESIEVAQLMLDGHFGNIIKTEP